MTDDQQVVVAKWLGSGSVNLFGRPFAGKDTQCRRLERWLDATVLGGGDILRNRDDLPLNVRQMLHDGLLIPVEDYLRIVTPYLGQADFAGRPLVLSSVGRFHGEEASILDATAQADHPIKAVIEIRLDTDQVWERWRNSLTLMDRGLRQEDAEHALKVRLQEFDVKTAPVLKFYQRAGLLTSINGDGDPDQVQAEIRQLLYELALADTYR